MVTITVYGEPGPQGSKSYKGMSKKGHAILVESSKKVFPWRQSVKWAAREQLLAKGSTGKICGAVSVQMIFTMKKPKSAPKKIRTFPSTRPDLSKLVRSTEDALTDAGIYEDDGRIVECHSMKVYPGEHPKALDAPGCIIQIERAA